ncbi:hypothetical protein SAMN05421637_0937 [Demequina mangrovi]|uniref:Uncharacterized protein n=1 Tax=Demequina mangrovi TaxID=1043493 RepID=A0A1H6WPT8_9MICO|nr:hypothetical protein SAMN05421637_0937 [Demequina mangrovi]
MVALVGIVGWTVASDRDADTDGDGLTDRVETSGWHTAGGAVHVTDPDVADTDGDGLADGVEAGAVVSGSGVEAVFEGVSDPTRADSDGDGLGDGSEVLGWADAAGAMFVTDPLRADTDGDGLADGLEAGAVVSGSGVEAVFEGVSDPTRADSDGDGLGDGSEVLGWADAAGAMFVTDPLRADTDGDGLADGLEAGAVVSGSGVEAVFEGVSDPTRADSDGDGLRDGTELLGWVTVAGVTYVTDPKVADTDGDGLSDGAEAGEARNDPVGGVDYALFSDPLVRDTDGDGLDDADEADLSLDPFEKDTDGDGLDDELEAVTLGTAPDLADTDGDGHDDGYEVENRESQGLDPLWFDERVDAATYAWEFAQGAVVGDVKQGDTVAWLLGNLASGASGAIPVVGAVTGSVADVRDAVGAAIQADWVGVSFSLVGLAPGAGDAAAIPAKVARFAARHPELVARVGAAVVSLRWLPVGIQRRVIRAMAPEEWDRLEAAGFSDEAILKLQRGKVGIDELAATMKRAGHVVGKTTRAFESVVAAQEFLEDHLQSTAAAVDTQVTLSTAACVNGCNDVARRFDVVADGVAHESKVGRVSLTPAVKRQIESDAHLIATGDVVQAHWHFFASETSHTIGASDEVLDLLDAHGIVYTIHPVS